jgi:hypothetical protein
VRGRIGRIGRIGVLVTDHFPLLIDYRLPRPGRSADVEDERERGWKHQATAFLALAPILNNRFSEQVSLPIVRENVSLAERQF